MTPWPSDAALKKSGTAPLLDRVRRSELANARAARACNRYLDAQSKQDAPK